MEGNSYQSKKRLGLFLILLLVSSFSLIRAESNRPKMNDWKYYKDSSFGFSLHYSSSKCSMVKSTVNLQFGPRDYKLYESAKLVSLADVPLIDQKCIGEGSGLEEPCHVPGIHIVALKGDPAQYNHPYKGAEIRDVIFNKLKGQVWGYGAEGTGVDYYFFPMKGNNTFVVVRDYMYGHKWPSEGSVKEIVSTFEYEQ